MEMKFNLHKIGSASKKCFRSCAFACFFMHALSRMCLHFRAHSGADAFAVARPCDRVHIRACVFLCLHALTPVRVRVRMRVLRCALLNAISGEPTPPFREKAERARALPSTASSAGSRPAKVSLSLSRFLCLSVSVFPRRCLSDCLPMSV